ncbi:hypothetical protein TNCV_2718671 [Trichonephila clavipes]|nr:hypothetical protein TNCV_2718671 [Trichonephila clavipes]
MHLVPPFGTPAPASSIPERMGSTVIRHYPAKLLEFPKSDFRFLFPPRKTPEAHFVHSKNFKTFEKAPVKVHVIDSHLELSGKFATISHIGFKWPVSKYARDQVFALQGLYGKSLPGVGKYYGPVEPELLNDSPLTTTAIASISPLKAVVKISSGRALKAQTVLKNEQNVGFRCGLREKHSLAD